MAKDDNIWSIWEVWSEGARGNRSSLTLEHGMWQILENYQNPSLMPACVSVCAKTTAPWLGQDAASPTTVTSCEHWPFIGEPFPLIGVQDGLHGQPVLVFSPGQTGRPPHTLGPAAQDNRTGSLFTSSQAVYTAKCRYWATAPGLLLFSLFLPFTLSLMFMVSKMSPDP